VREEALVTIVAIVCLTALEIVNLLTARIDGNILLTIGAIIGGLAGYKYREWTSEIKKRLSKH
jgi:hypothetical protein